MDYQLIHPEFSVQNGYSPIERVFASRGIRSTDIQHYLRTSRSDILDPTLLANMEEGAKMFITHLANNDKIFVQVDSDVDGFTSAAILMNYIYHLAPGTAQNNIIYRLHDGKQHGIIADTVPEDIKLVIVPDAGSNDLLEHKKLYDRGIDTLVLDHHELENTLNIACIINNQMNDYPNKTLSGAGVVYKFCQYIDSIIGQNYAEDLLDLAAIGIIADMMDLRNMETKELITIGLSHICNPFLEAFVEKQSYSLNNRVTPFGVSFYIAPYMNAVIRVGSAEEKLLLFESMLEYKAFDELISTKRGAKKDEKEFRVDQCCRVCTNAKNHQNKMCDSNIEMIEEIIYNEDLLSHPVLVIKVNDDLNQNLTGLIANQIMGKYQRPVLLLRPEITTDDNGEIVKFDWMGSGRCPGDIKLENFREFIANSGLVNYASGHASAFGVSIPDEKLDLLVQYIDARLSVSDFTTNYKVDFIWDCKDVAANKGLIYKLGELNDVWGQGLPQPYVVIENITVTANNCVLMSPDKSPTLKITLDDGITLIKFKVKQEEYEELYSKTGSVKINVVGTCNLNEWNGNISPQIKIEDYEVISKLAYYF